MRGIFDWSSVGPIFAGLLALLGAVCVAEFAIADDDVGAVPAMVDATGQPLLPPLVPEPVAPVAAPIEIVEKIAVDTDLPLFPFEPREWSRASASLNLDDRGGAGAGANVDLAFLSGTRFKVSGGGYGAREADSTSGYGSLGLVSSAQEEFSFGVTYEWQDRRLPVMLRCSKIICVEDANQIRQTVVEGVRTSLNYVADHWFAVVEPQSRRITVVSKNMSQDLFGYGAHISAGVFDIGHWDASIFAMHHWYTVDLSQFANAYRSPGGAQRWDLIDANQGLALGYTWRAYRAGLSASRSELAISHVVQYAYECSVSSPLGDRWSLDFPIGISVQSGYAPLWYFLPQAQFRW